MGFLFRDTSGHLGVGYFTLDSIEGAKQMGMFCHRPLASTRGMTL